MKNSAMSSPRLYSHSVSNPDRTFRVIVRRDHRDPTRVFISSGTACFTLDRDNAINFVDQIHDVIDLIDQTP